MKKIITVISIVLLTLGGGTELVQSTVNDFIQPHQAGMTNQKEAQNGEIALLFAGGLGLLQAWQVNREKRTYDDDFEVTTPFIILYDNMPDLIRWLNSDQAKFQQIIEYTFNPYIRSMVDIVKLEFGEKSKQLSLKITSTMPELHEAQANATFKSQVKEVIHKLLEEKLNHINDAFIKATLEKDEGGSKLLDQSIVKKAIDEEIEEINEAVKALFQKNRSNSDNNKGKSGLNL